VGEPEARRGAGGGRSRPVLALAALGVVFGDIGTSPLYALRSCFAGPDGLSPDAVAVRGVVSLVFWALLGVISFKYVTVVLRADNHGEGGILALMALATGEGQEGSRRSLWITLGLAGAALLCADALITPAISVLSALEGLESGNAALGPLVLPGAVAVLLGLFLLQPRGSGALGRAFGPLMAIWFVTIGALGAIQVVESPDILGALWPGHAVTLFAREGLAAFQVLGTVFLVVTGGEALYADLGHFGRRPIRLGWFAVVLPALVLCYLGQAAVLLREGPAAVDDLFYRLAPDGLVLPLVAMATWATVIASQAVITGAFSLLSQGVKLGVVPPLTVLRTSPESEGQVYVPLANVLLLAGTLTLLLVFRRSEALAGAYGLAVSGTMLLTTLLLQPVLRQVFGWRRVGTLLLLGAFLVPDTLFFGANLTKLDSGAWIPLAVAGVLLVLMLVWHLGRAELGRRLRGASMAEDAFLEQFAKTPLPRVPGTAVYLTSDGDAIPRTLLQNAGHNHVLHETVLLVTVSTAHVPSVRADRRLQVREIGQGLHRVRVRYGFRDQPDLPATLARIDPARVRIDPMQTSFFLGRQTVRVRESGTGWWRRWAGRLFAFLRRNALDPARYFQLPPNRVVEVGIQVEL